METLSTNALLGRLNWRYATKKFDPAKPIHPSVWAALEEALVLSPSSYGLQPYRFVVVSDLELRKKLRAVSWDQPQVTDASHFVVLAHKLAITEEDVESFVTLIAETRLAARDSLQSYYDMMMGDLVKGPQSASIREWAAWRSVRPVWPSSLPPNIGARHLRPASMPSIASNRSCPSGRRNTSRMAPSGRKGKARRAFWWNPGNNCGVATARGDAARTCSTWRNSNLWVSCYDVRSSQCGGRNRSGSGSTS